MLKKVINFFKKQNNLRYIAIGFLTVIFIGSGLLSIPGCIRPEAASNYHYIDALYMATSSVCVTGLITVDPLATYTIAGQVVLFFLIQIGGLGITTLGAGLIVAIRRRVSMKERGILQDTLNVEDGKGLLFLFKRVFLYTFVIEVVGFGLNLAIFLQPQYMQSYGYSFAEGFWKAAFHSIAAFNNSGFDILGGIQEGAHGAACLSNDVGFSLITAALIILGGIGFLVISDVRKNFFHPKKLSLHSKVVLTMTGILIVSGTLILALTEMNSIQNGSFSWLGAFMTSVNSRTAGFSNFNMLDISKAGRLVIIMLMFIGASPGSTGGGIKTTTLFVLCATIHASVRNKHANAFKYEISKDAQKKAMIVVILAAFFVLLSTAIVASIEESNQPTGTDLTAFLFEMTSAFGTVGLSMGITSKLLLGSKIVSIIVMYVGRIGPLTTLSLWSSGEKDNFRYAEGIIPIG